MEFWGVEVKAGEPLKVNPGDDKLIHLSQASLGESKKDKGNNSVPLFLKIDDQKLVLGALSQENYPQISFDLVFEKEFELSHNWKNGSVYFCGYKTDNPEHFPFLATDEFSDGESDSEEELAFSLPIAENGKPDPRIEQAKPAMTKANATKPESSAKPKGKVVEPNKDNTSDEDDSDDGSEDDSDEGSMGDESDDEDMLDIDDEDDEGTEDEETPKKAEVGKKRSTESATKTPLPAKKAKLATPQKTDGKKGDGHTATPHPSKQGGKTPSTKDKSKAQTPKSSGQVSCKTCSKTFNSDAGLLSHTKAKHSGGK